MADAMDSKSISRKGVGVRLPSLAPAPLPEARRTAAWREAARDVGGVLWPSLGRELRSAGAELGGFVNDLRRAPGRLLRDESRLARQEDVAERSRRAGWCLGVLAAAQGIDLLNERREPEGLRWFVGELIEARGLVLRPSVAELPTVVCRAGRTWEICLLAGWCALRVGESSDGVVRWKAAQCGAIKSLAFEVGVRPLASPCGTLLAPAQSDWTRVELEAGQLVLTWQ